MAMGVLGNGLSDAGRHEDALSVKEAEFTMMRRFSGSARNILLVQGNLANTYAELGHSEKAIRMRQEVYSGCLRLEGEDDEGTLCAAYNYAVSLVTLERLEEAKALINRSLPVARSVLGDSHNLTLEMRWKYAEALCRDTAATLDDVREAVKTLEDTERTARRVLGGANPFVGMVEGTLRVSREMLSACESACDTGSESISEAFATMMMTPSPR